MDFGVSVLVFIIAAVGTLVLGLLLKWVDRKVTALVQWRVGPPWYQPAVDILKLMGKENMMPSTARGTLFLLAPVIAVSSTAAAAAILWHSLIWPDQTFLGDLIVVVYLLMVPALMTMMGAGASGNPHASVGASREMKLLLSYELPLFLVIVVAIARAAAMSGGDWSLRLGQLIDAQAAGAPVLWSISGALAMIIAILCMQAKLGQVPFDLAEAECEIMSGVYVEYSGPSLAMFLMSRAMLLAVMPLLLIMLFWGGLNTAWWGYLTFAGKYVLLVALVTLIRNTNPRLRIDQTMRLFWYRLTPAAIVAVILAIVGAAKGVSWL
ncbi:MAG TPA: complex I subunit 1 family protein [Phycisphaerae bacterium]|nr:complex I subunit 1 family protein [Phycisphaerae bacterium]HUT60918.1 complex I subunit 1 family protein [Phycisphaerae bacterium]